MGLSISGALIIRIRFWETLYSHTEEPQNSIGNYFGPYINLERLFKKVSLRALNRGGVWVP